MNAVNGDFRAGGNPTHESKDPTSDADGTGIAQSATHREKDAMDMHPKLTKTIRTWPLSYRAVSNLVLTLDFVMITLTGVFTDEFYHAVVLNAPGSIRRSIAVSLFVAVIFIGLLRHQKLYNPSHLLLWNVQSNNVVWVWCTTFFILSGWLFVWKSGDDVSRGSIIIFWATGLPLLLLQRLFWRFSLERALKAGSLRGRKIIVVAAGSVENTNLAKNFDRHGYEMVCEFVLDKSSAVQAKIDLTALIAFVHGSQIEEVLLVVKGFGDTTINSIVDQLRVIPLPVTWITEGSTAELTRQPWSELGDAVAVEMQRSPRTLGARVLKRGLDIVGASFALILLLPLLAVVAVAIKLDSPGRVLFWQTRRGFNGKPFQISKFRTMKVLEDGGVIEQAKKNDIRVTRLGKWLRKTSIDEVPQLLNVLNGEMSLVGPRPHAVAHDDEFLKTVEHYAYRNHVKPGITGWAQVHGYRGETRTLEAIQRRVEFDLWYINNWTVWLDILILLRTIGEVVRGRNAY